MIHIEPGLDQLFKANFHMNVKVVRQSTVIDRRCQPRDQTYRLDG